LEEKLTWESVLRFAIDEGEIQGELIDPKGCGCIEPTVDSIGSHIAEKLKLKPEPLHTNASAVLQSSINPPDDIFGHLTTYTGVVSMQ